jgi:hypothetical protein
MYAYIFHRSRVCLLYTFVLVRLYYLAQPYVSHDFTVLSMTTTMEFTLRSPYGPTSVVITPYSTPTPRLADSNI